MASVQILVLKGRIKSGTGQILFNIILDPETDSRKVPGSDQNRIHNTVSDSEARYHGTLWYKRLGTIRESGSGSARKCHRSRTLFKIILELESQSSKVPGSDQNRIHNNTGLDSEARCHGTVRYKIRRYALRYCVG
jgi:hypothetical protein